MRFNLKCRFAAMVVCLTLPAGISCSSKQPPAAKGSPAAIATWKARFERDKELADPKNLFTAVAIPNGLALLGRVDEAIAEGERLAETMEYRDRDEVILGVVTTLSRVDRLQEALDLANQIEKQRIREYAVSTVAHRQVDRGDFEDGIKLLSKLARPRRDGILAKIASRKIDAGEYEQARKYISQIQDRKQRDRSQQLLEDQKSLPPKDDSAYVEKKVQIAARQFRRRVEQMKELRDLLETGDQAPAEPPLELMRRLARAEHYYALGKQKSGGDELSAAWKLAEQIKDEDYRITEVMSVACAAHRWKSPRLAHDILSKMIENPKLDEYYLVLSASGLKPLEAIAELLTDEELAPLIQRWQSSSDDLAIEYFGFAAACAKLGKFDRLDWLYRETNDPALKLMVINAAIEGLLQHNTKQQ